MCGNLNDKEKGIKGILSIYPFVIIKVIIFVTGGVVKMKKLLSIILLLAMCWSMTYTLIPVNTAGAVETGSAALAGERYTVDWTIPEVGDVPVTNAGTAGSGTETSLSFLSYDIHGYVSPKYPDTHKTNQSALGELTDGTVGSQHFLNDPWVGIYGNENNAIHVDLGAYHTNLSTVRLRMLSSPKEGIFLPSKITVAASADGVTYNKVSDATGLNWTANGVSTSAAYYVPTEYSSVVYEVVVNPQLLFNAQHLMIIFEHENGSDGFARCWTFVSEVQVNTSGAAVMPDFTNANVWPMVNLPSGETNEVNVGKNSVYQIIGTVGTGAASDNGRVQLTDGIKDVSNLSTNAAYVSVASVGGQFAIKLDLGNQQEFISKIAISGFADGSGITAPASVAVYASDTENVNDFGTVAFTSSLTSTGSKFSLEALASGKGFHSRYVTLIITPSSASSVVYLDEVEVYTTNESFDVENLAATENSVYKYVGKTIGEGTYYRDNKWTGSVNEYGVPNVGVYAKGDLNDGIKGTGTYLDPAWAGYNFAPGAEDVVEIVFDLGREYAKINSVKFTTLEYTAGTSSTNSSVPTNFTAYYSTVADTFSSTAAVVGTEVDTFVVRAESDQHIVYHTYNATLSNVTARYIKVAIPKSLRELHIDEIEIWRGYKETEVIPNDPTKYSPVNYLPDNAETDYMMSAVWLSYVELPNIYMVEGKYQADEQTYRARLANYLTAMANGGINTIMLHTRSHGDRYYGGPDTLFGEDGSTDSISPVSRYYTGSPFSTPTYDALEIFLEEAHKVGLSVQSWVNPLRLQTQSIMDSYSDTFAVKQMLNGSYNGRTANDMVGLVKNYYWLNIAYPEIRQYIVDAIMEPLYMYNFDGVIIDDYFYPEGMTAAFDSEAYAHYNKNDENKNAWRRSNTDALVQLLYKTIKDYKESLIFGISPFGNNIAINDQYASSYHMVTMFADVRKWATETWNDPITNKNYKYMDYLSPQLYWGFTSTAGAEFGTVNVGTDAAGDFDWAGSDTEGTEYYYLFADEYDESKLTDVSQWHAGKPSESVLEDAADRGITKYYQLDIRPYRRTVNGTKTVDGLIGEWTDLTKDGLVKMVPSLGMYMAYDSLNEARTAEYTSRNVIYDQLELMREHLRQDIRVGASYLEQYYETVLYVYNYNSRRGTWSYDRNLTSYPDNPNGYCESDNTETIPLPGSGSGTVTNGRVYGQIIYASDSFFNDYSQSTNYRTSDFIDTNRHLEIRNELKTFWQGDISANAR